VNKQLTLARTLDSDIFWWRFDPIMNIADTLLEEWCKFCKMSVDHDSLPNWTIFKMTELIKASILLTCSIIVDS
jgi:hypothetical protein